ncbi:MAG: MBL fold metallo-hydrolase [Rickettsiaceae bacterium]
MVKITILGCGASFGTPVIGCKCNTCLSDSPYNKRSRSAIIIAKNNKKILVDFGFDIKQQLLRAKIDNVDYAILTHDHADHVAGIEELRIFSFYHKKPIEIFTDFDSGKSIANKYHYLLRDNVMNINIIKYPDKKTIGNIDMIFFKQHHGSVNSAGIRIGNFVYSTDVVSFPKESEEFLHNIEQWVLDCASYESNFSHAGLDKVLQWNEKYKPKKILLTNMRHNIDYFEIQKYLPSNIVPLYDGFEITV